jgi:hypothetical protein
MQNAAVARLGERKELAHTPLRDAETTNGYTKYFQGDQ